MRRIALIAAAVAMASPASASETRSFVLSWFHLASAVQSQDKDCPQGLNPTAEENFKRWLKDQGKTPQEIEKALGDFPNTMYGGVGQRGRIDGKPVNVYQNPTSVPDPMLKQVTGKLASGFDLDGKVATGGFTDPETGEKGVDNQLFKAFGCIIAERGEPGTRPTYPSVQWDTDRPQMSAWLIQVSGIDDYKNDEDVTVEWFQATSPAPTDANGETQHDMTFEADTNPSTKNKMKARIKNGMIWADPIDLHLVAHRYQVFPNTDLKNMRLRLVIKDDGTLRGMAGGYQDWLNLYSGFARGGAGYEVNVSLDLPGMYYNLRKLADSTPDAKGQNTMISASYAIEGVPAFIHRQDMKTADAK